MAAEAQAAARYVKRRMGRPGGMPDRWPMRFARTTAVGAVAAATLIGSAAGAAPRPMRVSTALHRCGTETCLMVSGHRADADAPVRIAGHAVIASGGRNWRAIVPLGDVRVWSATAARWIAVEVVGAAGGTGEAALPIGLLGHVTELASLDVSVRR